MSSPVVVIPPVLPNAGMIDSALWALRNEAVASGVLLPEWPVLLNTVSLLRPWVKDFCAELVLVGSALSRLPLLSGAGSRRVFAAMLGERSELVDLLSAHGEAGAPARWDFVIDDDGRASLFEVNASYSLGGLLFHQLERELVPFADPLRAGRSRMIDAGRVLAQHLVSQRALIEDERLIAIVDTTEMQTGYSQFNHSIAESIAVELGREVVSVAVSELRWIGRRAHVGTQEVGSVVLLASLDEVSSLAEFRPLLGAMEAGTLAWWSDPGRESIEGNKAAFALLSSAAVREQIPSAEAAAVARLVTPTHLVGYGHPVPVVDRRQHYVLKPTNGYAGMAITGSWLQSPEDFWRSVDERCRGPQLWVLQERRQAPETEVVVQSQDTILHGSGRIVLGLNLIAGHPAGGLSRSHWNGPSGRVTNAGQGAAVGPLYFHPADTPRV